jgi:hypothetical protein
MVGPQYHGTVYHGTRVPWYTCYTRYGTKLVVVTYQWYHGTMVPLVRTGIEYVPTRFFFGTMVRTRVRILWYVHVLYHGNERMQGNAHLHSRYRPHTTARSTAGIATTMSASM